MAKDETIRNSEGLEAKEPSALLPNGPGEIKQSGDDDVFSSLSRKRTLRSSIFEFLGYGTQQFLRLASNIILSRLLFPEAFGLASMVTIILTGLTMLSDMGIQQFVIQSPRGEDPAFLNTAFTFQALRGFILAAMMVALARPAALFFKEPQLFALTCVGAIQLAAIGLRSTSLFTLRRRLTIGWVTALELGQSVLTLVIMIPWAKMRPSVFPLVVGGTVSACVHALVTHFLPVGYHNRFHWNKEAYREMSRFGRWIFGSSAVTFFGAQIDRVFYGKFLGMAWLGIYSIALNLSEAVSALLNRLIGGVVYPLLSQASRDSRSNMSAAYYRVRLRLDLLAMTGTGFLAGAGGWIIRSLWDERYADAAWILRILCVRVALFCVIGQGENCLTSMGLSRYGFWRSVSRFIAVSAGLPIGWRLGGVVGVLWASVIAELPAVFFIWPKLHAFKILRIHRELLSAVLFLAAFAVGSIVLPWLPEIHVGR